jgi:type IV secretion system protein VirB2
MFKKLPSIKKLAKQASFGLGLWYVSTNLAFASVAGESMPWEGPLQKIMDSISGPVAKILGVIVIVIAGFGIAFGESGSGVRRLFQVVMGLAIAFTAASIVTDLFQGSSGVVF